MNETNMVELLKLADVASRQTDRWLFIAALLLLLGFGAVGFKFLLNQIAELTKDAKESRKEYHDTLRKIINDQNVITTNLQVSLDRNTEALKANNQWLERLNKREL